MICESVVFLPRITTVVSFASFVRFLVLGSFGRVIFRFRRLPIDYVLLRYLEWGFLAGARDACPRRESQLSIEVRRFLLWDCSVVTDTVGPTVKWRTFDFPTSQYEREGAGGAASVGCSGPDLDRPHKEEVSSRLPLSFLFLPHLLSAVLVPCEKDSRCRVRKTHGPFFKRFKISN